MGAIRAVVMSGKGGTSKTACQALLAGEASRAGMSVLLIDVDPERNLSNHFQIPQHSTGLGSVFEEAGVTSGDGDAEKGAKRAAEEIVSTHWQGVDLLPAGASLQGIGQVAIADVWLLNDILERAGIYDRYDLILFDTGGRTGSLVTEAMYAAEVAYAPVVPTKDAVRKALEARTRVERIQRAHPLRWAGVVLMAFSRNAIEDAIRTQVIEAFGEQVRAEIERRTIVNEAFQLGDRLGDYPGVLAARIAQIIFQFLERDLMGRPGYPEGVLR